jgi:phosphohistidine phosphatase SixA
MLVFVLRHADREPDPVDELSPAGQERAELLARMLQDSGVSFAFHSDTARARRTLDPLKQKLGDALTVEEIAAVDVQRTVDAVRSLPADAVAAVVGHGNTVGAIVEGLGGEPMEPMDPSAFDQLFVLFTDVAGAVTLLRLRYGAAT